MSNTLMASAFVAFEAAQNQFGGGGSADTPEGRERNEKITDTAREKFEQYTGYAYGLAWLCSC
jgi:hypothetical protein